MSACKVITWERSSTYVTQRVSKDGPLIHARCGIVDIAGNYWEGFERLGRVMLDEGTYPSSVMYIDPARGPVVNPWHKQMVPDSKNPGHLTHADILFHSATDPSDLEGCIGVGWIYSNQLTESRAAMSTIYHLAGGSKGNDKPVITVKVIGARTPFSANPQEYLRGLTPYQGI